MGHYTVQWSSHGYYNAPKIHSRYFKLALVLKGWKSIFLEMFCIFGWRQSFTKPDPVVILHCEGSGRCTDHSRWWTFIEECQHFLKVFKIDILWTAVWGYAVISQHTIYPQLLPAAPVQSTDVAFLFTQKVTADLNLDTSSVSLET